MAQGIQKRVRADFKKTVYIYTRFKSIETAKSFNISLNGIFVETEELLKKGSKCELEIALTPAISLHIKGQVTRTTNSGMGITFNEMDETTLFHLKNIVLYNTHNPVKFLDECEKKPGFK